ncbi:helix-turn-helix domain-containing protein [Paenibacillus ehimensis]|uniref:helix-turn-helix domain-containing protein n=1 Tax=Paenibacillus ehimensis TaxID=79264 RepID=UPI000471AFF2|nr:helix-turn-helix transcriptional regulator [Paenibacillus ehimensis]
MSLLAKTIGKQIRHYRTLKGWTQEQLAEVLESQGTYIGRVERGEQNIQIQTLEKIANALNTSVCVSFDHEQFEQLKSDEWIWKTIMLLKQQDIRDQERAFRVLCEMFR